MPEAVVEKEVCGLCGVERRPGAAFCYNCGGALVEAPPINAAIPKPEDIPLDGEFVIAQAPPAEVPVAEAPEAPEIEHPAVPEKERRRHRRKKVKPKVVEVEWKEPESMGIGFIVWTIIFVIVCVTLVAVAMYIR